MFKNKYPGKFIAIEGIDGSGSTTQSDMICRELKADKKSCFLTQEPTNYIIGNILRGYLSGEFKTDNQTYLQLLFAADRAAHLEHEIIPRLKKGINVLTDRYFLSSLAYGSLDIDDTDWLYQINNQFLLPDLTILIKVPIKVALKRIKDERTGIEMFEKEASLSKVWNAYETLSQKYPNIKIVDGEKDVYEIHKQIEPMINRIIK